jgi:hypothetical protein
MHSLLCVQGAYYAIYIKINTRKCNQVKSFYVCYIYSTNLLRILLRSPLKWRCQYINKLPEHAKQRRKPESPSPDPHSVDEEVYQDIVAYAEAQEDTEVPPLILRLDVEGADVIDA